MIALDGNGLLAAVLRERWRSSELGTRLNCADENGTRTADLTQTRVPSHLSHLASTRLQVVAAAPAAVRLALFVAGLSRELEGEDKDGCWLTEQQWQELTHLAQVALEGSR